MIQAYRDPIKDAARRRTEFLWRFGQAPSKLALGAAAGLCLLIGCRYGFGFLAIVEAVGEILVGIAFASAYAARVLRPMATIVTEGFRLESHRGTNR